jgi:hypothetical protein
LGSITENQATAAVNKEFVREFIQRVFNEHDATAIGTISALRCGGTKGER